MTRAHRLLTVGAAFAVATAATPAQSQTLLFNLTGPYQVTFQLDAHPTPSGVTSYSNYFYDVPGLYGGQAKAGYLAFFTEDLGGGFQFEGADGDNPEPLDGPRLFDLPLNKPTFHPGTFNLTGNSTYKPYVLTVTAAPALPEVSSWSMMIAGFGLVGAGLRSRKVRTNISFA